MSYESTLEGMVAAYVVPMSSLRHWARQWIHVQVTKVFEIISSISSVRVNSTLSDFSGVGFFLALAGVFSTPDRIRDAARFFV